MAKLTAAARNKLPSSSFAVPEKDGYPIHDRSHAQNALARVSQHGSPAEKAKVRAAVHRRYPTMGKEGSPAEEASETPEQEAVEKGKARARKRLRTPREEREYA